MKVIGFLVLTGFLITGFFLGCGSDSSSDDAASVPASEGDEAQNDEIPAGALAVAPTPAEAGQYAAGTVESTMDSGAGEAFTTGTLVIGLQTNSTQSPDDKYCSTVGEPWDIDNNTVFTDPTKALKHSRAFYCAINFNTYSPDSILGTFVIANGLLCSLDAAGVTFEEGGKDFDQTVEIKEPCFSAKAIKALFGLQGNGIKVTGKATKLAEGSAWTHRMDVTSNKGDGEEKETWLFHTSRTKVAAMMMDIDTAGNPTGNAWTFSMDPVGGVVRYEKIGVGPISRGGGGHTRIMVTGTIDAETKKFSAVTAIEGIYALGVGGDPATKSVTVSSIKGSQAAGYKVLGYSCPDGSSSCDHDVAANWVAKSNSCIPETACSGNDGITFTESSHFDFVKVQAVDGTANQAVVDYLKDPKPLDFSSVAPTLVPASP